MNEQDLIQELLQAISTGDDEQAETAAQACRGRIDILPALRPLLSDEDADRRWWAVRTLALMEDASVGPLLEQRLADEDEATRCAAALALGQQGIAGSIPALVGRLADESGWVRDCAADALALIGEPALTALTGAMADPRDGVRVRAASALRRILTTLVQPGTKIQIASPVGRATGMLFEALNDPNYLVHQHAYEALERMGLLDMIYVR